MTGRPLPEPRWEMWNPDLRRSQDRWAPRIAAIVILGAAAASWALVLAVVLSVI